MNNKIRLLILVTIIVAAGYLILSRTPDEPLEPTLETVQEKDIEQLTSSAPKDIQKIPTHASENPDIRTEHLPAKPMAPADRPIATSTKAEPAALQFEVDEDGLAIVDGDIVLGSPADSGVSTGYAKAPDLVLWPEGKVPFYIQPDLENPERVIRALAMFEDVISFVPYQNEQDVLVFQNANSECKSYVGKVGGKQPIWIGPGCGTTEIAHEIMHALGFIHEQNRSDRDAYVKIQMDNVLESSAKNFGLFPASMMTVSGKSSFDFQSIMLYPPSMFSKNGQPTMVTVDPKNRIDPLRELSPADLKRISEAYPR
jgi:hypothetical protein